MSTTTTKNMKYASGVLAEKLKKTETDMKRLMEKAGVPEYKTVKMVVPKDVCLNDDVLTIGLNGVMFYFQRGKTVNMPTPLVEILENTGNL